MACQVCGKAVGVGRNGTPYARCFDCKDVESDDWRKCCVAGCDRRVKKPWRACFNHKDVQVPRECGDCSARYFTKPTPRAMEEFRCTRCKRVAAAREEGTIDIRAYFS